MTVTPATCAAAAAQTASIDLDTATDWRVFLQGLFQAYTMVATGNQRVRVRVQERWTDFARANLKELREFYMTMYQQAARAGTNMCGLPDLSPGLRVRRGPGVRTLHGPYPYL